MNKRYGIFGFTPNNGLCVERLSYGFFTATTYPLFEVEREAIEFAEKLNLNAFLILPIYVNKEIADKETYRSNQTA